MTSIEWLIKELYTEMNMSGDGRVFDEILEEAKEMHKQEIITAFDEGQEYEYQYHINNAPKFDSQTYYQETFVSKGSDFKQFSLYEHKDTITSADTQVSKTFLESVPQQEICISCDEKKEISQFIKNLFI